VGRPGKYQRSFGGLVAALVLTVLAVGLLLWFLGLFRSDLEVRQEPVDYLDTVEGLQQADRERQEAGEPALEPVYPERLPEGWIATAAEVPTPDPPSFEIRMLTDDEEFVALHQAAGTTVERLVQDEVDDAADAGGIWDAPAGAVAEHWQTFTDEGGDTAYATQVDGQVLLVFGSAPAAELEELIGLLTRAPVD
jgi:hypothetical protein